MMRESQHRKAQEIKLQNVDVPPEKIRFRRELDEFIEGNDPYDILIYQKNSHLKMLKKYRRKA